MTTERKYLSSLPSETIQLASDVLGELRTDMSDQYSALTSKQQRIYSELGDACLDHLTRSPDAACLFGKLGPNEEAYGMNLAEINGAALRVHFYAQEGAQIVDPDIMRSGVIDVQTFGTPHNHRGNISAVVPRGELVHHSFQEGEGEDYTAGHIQFEEATDPTKGYKFRRSIFVPVGIAGLDSTGSIAFNSEVGYQMDKETIHVVSWSEPTVTVFFNDFSQPHESTIYQRPGIEEPLDRPRILTPTQREKVWSAFMNTIKQR